MKEDKIKYFVSRKIKERIDFVRNIKTKDKKVAIYNHIPLRELEACFDECIKLTDLYKDQVFLNTLPKINNKTVVFFVDLGLDYCTFLPNYIKPYLKLTPIRQQTDNVYLIDGFAFYNTEKSIYRPFLYIDDGILSTTVQEFYNVGIYKDFEGNKVENYIDKIRPYIDIRTKPIEIQVVSYSPLKKEKREYEALKERVIMTEKLSKQRVVNELQKFIKSSKSLESVLLKEKEGDVLYVEENTTNSRKKMYKDIILQNPKKVVFYDSGFYGIDQIELERTKGALTRHNKLIELF